MMMMNRNVKVKKVNMEKIWKKSNQRTRKNLFQFRCFSNHLNLKFQIETVIIMVANNQDVRVNNFCHFNLTLFYFI